MSRKESDIQRAILTYLHAKGIMAHQQKGLGIKGRAGQPWTRGGTNGISDIAGIMPGGFALKIEVKTAKGVTSNLQGEYIEAARKMGACAFVARSVDDVIEGIKEWEGRNG